MGNSQSSATAKFSTKDKAILDLKIQRDRLRKYQKQVSAISDRETAIAKECLRLGKKDKALLALRRKKYQETLLSQTDAQLEQLQTLVSEVEFAQVQKDVMFGLSQGTAVLKQIQTEMGGLEGVEKLLDESAEAQAYVKEVGDMLAGKLSNADEDEVEDEFERLEREAMGVQDGDISLPSVPQTELERKQQQRERAEERRQRILQQPMLAE